MLKILYRRWVTEQESSGEYFIWIGINKNNKQNVIKVERVLKRKGYSCSGNGMTLLSIVG